MLENSKKVIRSLFFALLFAGCVSIPKEAIELNKSVSTGVQTMYSNTENLIDSWEKLVRQELDEKFDEVYEECETRYRRKFNIDENNKLSPTQTRQVAALVALAWSRAVTNIDQKVETLRETNRKNRDQIRNTNDSITGLLESAESFISVQTNIVSGVARAANIVLPIPQDFITSLLTDNFFNNVERLSSQGGTSQ